MEYRYHVVDVFTTTALEGNALAVFADAAGMETKTMQRVARELNLSETTFILPAESRDGATRVRIFTPMYEMSFAGHPTIGTAFVMRKLGLVEPGAKTFALEENVGRVPVRVDEGDNPLIWLTTPPIQKLAEYPRQRCAAALSLGERDLIENLPCELLSAGNPNVFIPVKDRATVDRVLVSEPVFTQLTSDRTEPTCVFVFAPTETGAYSRMFAPELGVVEDPATGSATGPLAAFMMQHGLASRAAGTRFLSEQGTKMGRRSLLHVFVHGENGLDGIEVGGNVTEVATATLTLP